MNSLIFLGTAGDVEVMARQQRGSGGILVKLNDNQLHLDPGPSSLYLAKLAKASMRDTLGIIATNASLLRCNDLNAAVSAMTLDGMDRHGVLLPSRNALEMVPQHYKDCVEGVLPLTPQNKVGLNNVTIMPVKTVGKDESGVGVKLSIEKLTIGYTGDTSWYESMAKDYEGCDILIINVKHPPKAQEQGHLNIEETAKLIEAVKPKAAFLTGFGAKLLQLDIKDLARQMQRQTRVEVNAATDGLRVELDQYKRK